MEATTLSGLKRQRTDTISLNWEADSAACSSDFQSGFALESASDTDVQLLLSRLEHTFAQIKRAQQQSSDLSTALSTLGKCMLAAQKCKGDGRHTRHDEERYLPIVHWLPACKQSLLVVQGRLPTQMVEWKHTDLIITFETTEYKHGQQNRHTSIYIPFAEIFQVVLPEDVAHRVICGQKVTLKVQVYVPLLTKAAAIKPYTLVVPVTSIDLDYFRSIVASKSTLAFQSMLSMWQSKQQHILNSHQPNVHFAQSHHACIVVPLVSQHWRSVSAMSEGDRHQLARKVCAYIHPLLPKEASKHCSMHTFYMGTSIVEVNTSFETMVATSEHADRNNYTALLSLKVNIHSNDAMLVAGVHQSLAVAAPLALRALEQDDRHIRVPRMQTPAAIRSAYINITLCKTLSSRYDAVKRAQQIVMQLKTRVKTLHESLRGQQHLKQPSDALQLAAIHRDILEMYNRSRSLSNFRYSDTIEQNAATNSATK